MRVLRYMHCIPLILYSFRTLQTVCFDVFNKSASSSIVYCLSPSALLFSNRCAQLIVCALLVPLEITEFSVYFSSEVSLMMIFCLVIFEWNSLIFNYKGTKKAFNIHQFYTLIFSMLYNYLLSINTHLNCWYSNSFSHFLNFTDY